MSKLILKIVLGVGCILCIFLIILVSLDCIDNVAISNFVSKYKEALKLIAGFGIIMGVLFSYIRLHQQETVINLQNKSLDELKNNNQLLKYKNHIDHYRSNLEYIENGYIENVSIQTKSMLAYHRFYSSSKFGNFNLNKDFSQLISREIEHLISLLTDYESKREHQNEMLFRFIEIYEASDRILGCIGMKCDLNVSVKDDDGRAFPFEVYEYISTCFKALVTIFDGELGQWTRISIAFSNINYENTADDSVCFDAKYYSECLELLTTIINGQNL